MNRFELQTEENKTAFLPGEEIKGIAVWQLDRPVKAIELRLFWYTSGKGTQDVGVAETMRFDNPETEGGRPFSFKAPNGPYSFTGKLISITWALELVVLPKGETARLDFVISPTGVPCGTSSPTQNG